MKVAATLSFFVLLLGSISVSAQNSVEINGIVLGDTTGIIHLSQEGQSLFDADTSLIANRKFSLTKELDFPECFSILQKKTDQREFFFLPLFLAPGDKVDILLYPGDSIAYSTVKGSRMNEEYQDYRKNIENLGEEKVAALREAYFRAEEANDSALMEELAEKGSDMMNELHILRRNKALDYIKAHPDSHISAYILYDYYKRDAHEKGNGAENPNLTEEEMDYLLGLLKENARQSKYARYVATRGRNQIGTKATDFTLNDAKGNKTSLFEYSKDKTTLLVFWASWCAPCRKANPQLEQLYQENKESGFTIVGISQDRDSKTLNKSILTDGITWTNLLDRKKDSVTDLFNIQSLPAKVLIDAKGTIIAINPSLEEIKRLLGK